MERRKILSITYIFLISVSLFTLYSFSYANGEYEYTTTIQAESPEAHAWFGYSVAVCGNIVVVGEPSADFSEGSEEGKAYIFNAVGEPVATLFAPTPIHGGRFGWSVSVNGDTVVVGERMADKAYIFNSEGDYQATLQPEEAVTGADFGNSVAVSGDVIVVGAPMLSGEGGAYIFNSDGEYQATLVSPEPEHFGRFGSAVAVSGNIIVVGEHEVDISIESDEGKAHIFDPDGNYEKTLQAPTPEAGANFGRAVAVSEDIIVIGEPLADKNGITDSGRVHIYDSEGTYETTIESPAPQNYGWFGISVAVSGDIIVVGEFQANVEEGSSEGRAYTFDSSGNLLQTFESPSPQPSALFGCSVSVSGNTVVIGEKYADGEVNQDEGRAYIFSCESINSLLIELEREVAALKRVSFVKKRFWRAKRLIMLRNVRKTIEDVENNRYKCAMIRLKILRGLVKIQLKEPWRTELTNKINTLILLLYEKI